jgi:hypothetical protein
VAFVCAAVRTQTADLKIGDALVRLMPNPHSAPIIACDGPNHAENPEDESTFPGGASTVTAGCVVASGCAAAPIEPSIEVDSPSAAPAWCTRTCLDDWRFRYPSRRDVRTIV